MGTGYEVSESELKQGIFAELDRLLEADPMNLLGITLQIPVEFEISRERSRELLREWAASAIRRYRKVVEPDGGVRFRRR